MRTQKLNVHIRALLFKHSTTIFNTLKCYLEENVKKTESPSVADLWISKINGSRCLKST